MAHDGSVTKLIGRAIGGDDDAFSELFRRYFPRLVGLARKRLAGIPDPDANEEDAALAAMASFCRLAPKGQFAQLTDRNTLWSLLATMTAYKVSEQIKHRTRAKRDARLGVRSLQEANNSDEKSRADEVFSREPTPEDAAMFSEDLDRLLRLLNDPTLQQVALRTLEGDSTTEIAEKLDRSKRTVERKLESIRQIWSGEPPR